MRTKILLRALALAAALPAGGEARACVYLPVSYGDGMRPNAWEVRVQEERAARDLVRWRRPGALAALDLGTDAPAELARMLVPNIRPVPIQRSDCGVENEIDLADGEETVADWLAGTYLARHHEEFQHMTWSYRGETQGAACNAEFRDRFAAYLRRRLDPAQLRASYLFLMTRWSATGLPVRRLVAFDGGTRRPPVRWTTRYWPDIERWTARSEHGRALRQVIDDFWRESLPLLDSPERACPAATARWPAAQARIVAEIERRNPQMTRAMRAARQP